MTTTSPQTDYYKESTSIPMQGIPVQEVSQPIVVETADESAVRRSNRMVGIASGMCVVALVLVLVAEYYMYLYLFKDESDNHNSTDGAANALLVISSVLAIAAAVLGSFQIRNLPEGSRKTCKIGIAVVGVIFIVAAVVLFAIWVSPRDDDAPIDSDDQNFRGLTIFVGCIMQIITFVVVIVYLCISFCVTSCCCPPPTVSVNQKV